MTSVILTSKEVRAKASCEKCSAEPGEYCLAPSGERHTIKGVFGNHIERTKKAREQRAISANIRGVL